MTPEHHEPLATIYAGDCVAVMAALPEASVDAIVCDPPYGLEFMGKEWDRLWTTRDKATADLTGKSSSPFVAAAVDRYVGGETAERWHEVWARAALHVLKPGAHLVAFGGTRTFHRLTCALEDAGFEIRDCLMWLYGSGFPKSLDVSKAIDKAAGAEREIVGANPTYRVMQDEPSAYNLKRNPNLSAPATDSSRAWNGWGTALKPAWEPIILARKPLGEKNVAANVLKHGTGAVNVDACRIGTDTRRNAQGGDNGHVGTSTFRIRERRADDREQASGRWPANLILDEAAARLLDAQSGESKDGVAVQRNRDGQVHNEVFGAYRKPAAEDVTYGGSGGASRFFYTAKADREDRDGSKHPTVKPVDLMKWLITLVTPPGGVVLDPFLGSGTTVYAARELGIKSIGIEREPAYIVDAIARLRQGVLL